MNLDALSAPLPGDSPTGRDCEPKIQSMHFSLMTEYLVERAVQRARERAADQPYGSEAEAKNAASLREDGKRRLKTLEGILKDALGISAINAEQVTKAMSEKVSALLANEGKDLRLVPFLAMASTTMEGLPGYLSALRLADSLLKQFPADLYPRPDPAEPNDHWQRANAVSELLSDDSMRVMLSSVVVIDTKQTPRITLADLVGGLHEDIPAAEVSASDLAAAIAECGPERVGEVLRKVEEIDIVIANLKSAFDAGSRPTAQLADVFRRAAARIKEFASDALPASSEGGTAVMTGEAQAAESADSRPAAPAGGLRTREDARRMIQEVVQFISKLEPGHPAPLLLRRADRLLGMNFFDIIKDIAPSALSEVERIAGPDSSGQ